MCLSVLILCLFVPMVFFRHPFSPSSLLSAVFYNLPGGFCRGFGVHQVFLLLVGLSEGSLWNSVLGSPVPLSWRENVWTWGKKICVTFVLWLVFNEMLIVPVLFGLIQQRNEVKVQNYSWQLVWHLLGCLILTWWGNPVKLYQKSRLWFEFCAYTRVIHVSSNSLL